jgi:PAS domain S-box-containing protein
MAYFNIYAVSILVSIFLCLGLGLFVYYKNPSSRTNKYYLSFSIVLWMWMFVKFNIQVAENYDMAFFWQKANFVYMILIPLLFSVSISFSGNEKILSRRLVKILLYAPMLLSIFVYVTSIESGLPYEQDWGWAYDVPMRSLNVIDMIELIIGEIWLFTVGIISVIVFIYPFFKSKDLLKRKQSFIMGIGFVILFIIGIFDYYWGYRNNLPEFLIFGFMFLAMFMGYTMWKYELFSIDPIRAAESIVSTMSDALLLVGKNKRILDVNKSTENMLGYRRKELLNKHFEEIFPDKNFKSDDGNVFNQITQRDVTKDLETVFITKDKNEIPISLSTCLIKGRNDELKGIVCIGRDITDRKRTEKELIEHTDELERLNSILSGRESKLQELKIELKKKRLKIRNRK